MPDQNNGMKSSGSKKNGKISKQTDGKKRDISNGRTIRGFKVSPPEVPGKRPKDN